MNILIISYLFPPINNPQAVLSGRLAKYLQRGGHKVIVLAATNAEVFNSSHGIDKSLCSELCDTKIIYVDDKNKNAYVSELFKKAIYHERFIYWIRKATKTANIICKSNKIDIIYSLAFPMASNIVGMRIKKETGMPWVAHFSDPGFLAFNLQFKSPLKTFLSRAIEKKIFSYADGITFVNQETLLRNTAFDPDCRVKCRVIPHFYDPDIFNQGAVDHPPNSVIRFSYIGSLYGQRKPFELFNVLIKAKNLAGKLPRRIELDIYGAIDPNIMEAAKEMNLPSWIKIHGEVSYRASIKAMLGSSYLILIDWSSEDNLYTPSKLIDYLAAVRPIIGITPFNSFSGRLLSDLGYPVIKPGDIDSLGKLFSDLLDGFCLMLAPKHLDILDYFRADYVVNELAQFLSTKVRSKSN